MKNRKKLSFIGALFFGLNYIVGVGFVTTIGSLYQQLGLWYILAFFVVSTMAFAVGISYATTVKRYPNSYSSGFIVTRRALGKVGGFINIWSSYIQSPTLAIVCIAGIVWAFQGTSVYNHHLWIIIIGAGLLFFLIIFILNHGVKASSIFVSILSSLKWVVILGVLIFTTIHFFISLGDLTKLKANMRGNGALNLTFLDVCSSIGLMFFSFGGIEGLTIINSEVKNPKKTVPIVIGTIIIAAFVIYVWFFVTTLNAIGPKDLANPNINPMNKILDIYGIGAFSLISTVLLWIVIPSQIANKATLRTQSAWVQTRNILVLTIDGIFPRSFGKVNKYGSFSRCVWLDSIICLVFIVFYIVVSLVFPDFAKHLESTLNAASLTFIFMYSTTLISILIENAKGKLKLSLFEKILAIYGFISIMFLAVCLIAPVVVAIYNPEKINPTQSASLTRLDTFFPFIFFFALLLIGFVIFAIANSHNKKIIKEHGYMHYPISLLNYIHDNPELKLYQYFPEGENHPLALALANNYHIPDEPTKKGKTSFKIKFSKNKK